MSIFPIHWEECKNVFDYWPITLYENCRTVIVDGQTYPVLTEPSLYSLLCCNSALYDLLQIMYRTLNWTSVFHIINSFFFFSISNFVYRVLQQISSKGHVFLFCKWICTIYDSWIMTDDIFFVKYSVMADVLVLTIDIETYGPLQYSIYEH